MSMMVLEHWSGEATRVPVEATAFPHGAAGHNLVLASVWTDPAASGANIEWTRDTYTALQPFFSHRRYVNYLEDEAGDDPIRDAYGPNYERLTRLKAKYDPGNLFRVNQNIEPRPKES
jgi:FAD/FMN-containing dehydrogenase